MTKDTPTGPTEAVALALFLDLHEDSRQWRRVWRGMNEHARADWYGRARAAITAYVAATEGK